MKLFFIEYQIKLYEKVGLVNTSLQHFCFCILSIRTSDAAIGHCLYIDNHMKN